MLLLDDNVQKLYADGRSCSALARLYECSTTYIYNYLKKMGVQLRSKSDANKIFPDYFFIALYNVGLSASQVGRLLGVDPSTVTKRLHSIGFPLRSRHMACKIRYTEQEFKQYFMTKSVINKFVCL